MTIVACAVEPEGVVLGAESASTTITLSGVQSYLNHEQKVFEIGTNSTLGIATWGLGRLSQDTSYRTLIAQLADDLTATPPSSVRAAAEAWVKKFWVHYERDVINGTVKELSDVREKAETPERRKEAAAMLEQLAVGFCLGGYCLPERKPEAYIVEFSPSLEKPPAPVAVNGVVFCGVSQYVHRLLGIDVITASEIIKSQKWGGTPEELVALCAANRLHIQHPLPIREAADLIYSCIFTTIKLMKFTLLPLLCGGPIEIAMITTDRPFRWVQHKELDVALG